MSVLRFNLWITLALAMTLAGCDRYPRDPSGSLEHVMQRGVLRVGALSAEPWVTQSEGDELTGAEGRLIQQFAEELGVQVETHWHGEEDLFQMLDNHDLDLIVGGMSQRNPWSAHASFTFPYYTNRLIVGVPSGTPSISDLEGIAVGILPNSPLSSALENKGAIVTRVDDYATASLPLAGPTWRLEPYGLVPTDIQLQLRKHVVAVPRGENALLMRLEDFLLTVDPEQIENWLERETAP